MAPGLPGVAATIGRPARSSRRRLVITEIELRIVDGPDKPDLQWAVAYPERHLRIHFDTTDDAVAAHLDRLEEFDDGTRFGLQGHLASGVYKGWPFKAVYDLTTRSGVLKAQKPG